MKQYKVIVAGATGMVGRKMVQVLEERKFPVGELIPMASARSVGKTVKYNGKEWNVQELSEENIKNSKAEIALFSAGGSVSKEFAPVCAKYGVTVIDNSSAWRMDPNVPLVVPEVNREKIFSADSLRHPGRCSFPPWFSVSRCDDHWVSSSKRPRTVRQCVR